MLKRSFIFIPGIGPRTEKMLWNGGISDWDTFLSTGRIHSLGPSKKEEGDRRINEASEMLSRNELPYFSKMFRPSESWRLWSTFRERVRYLDIETTGTRRDSPITVVGVWDGVRYDAAVRGFNLTTEKIKSMLEGATLLVTFNGSAFDLPLLQHQFPGSVQAVPHMDLRFVAYRAGFGGGLKSLEVTFGIERPKDVLGMSGEDAVRLWNAYIRDRNRNALKLILKYNREDIVNLQTLSRELVDFLEHRTLEQDTR
jgi:uncharacterized protein YprB with RNaseH-like and TPR domain